jgi:hypothetical protein
MSYQEAINSGIAPNKTSSIQLKNDQIYKLDYVRDKDRKYPSYGHLEMPHDKFKDIVKVIDVNYADKNVGMVTLFGKEDDLSSGQLLKKEHLTGYLIAYLDKGNNAKIDYIDINTGRKESHFVSGFYATVKNYFSGLNNDANRSMTDIVCNGYENNTFVYLKKADDTLYKKINRL